MHARLGGLPKLLCQIQILFQHSLGTLGSSALESPCHSGPFHSVVGGFFMGTAMGTEPGFSPRESP
eukprot:4189804-Amphidinium_carterae.1